jgi:phosphatidate cytidylyltransferase
MAFNVQTFKTRSLTAIVFVIVMMAGLLWNLISFIILFSIVAIGALFEWNKLLKKIVPQRAGKYWLYYSMGVLYIVCPILMLIYFRLDFDLMPLEKMNTFFAGAYIPVGLILLIWTNDTMAYIVGSIIGKRQLSKISPKKTWEGTIGGALLTMGVAVLLQKLFNVYEVQDWLVFGFCAAVFGTMGDLIESKIKRLADVKDSGTFMPGHGGFLDRFDSLLFATPFTWLYVVLFMR